jgi:lysozyme
MPVTDIYSQLRRDEDVRKFPYTDTAGKLTIGVGHNLTDKGLSDAAIDFILEEDINDVIDELNVELPWVEDIGAERSSVILNMAFNLGVTKMKGFTKFLQAARVGDWETAANEMRDSEWARQVGDRAVRLEQQMRTGAWV